MISSSEVAVSPAIWVEVSAESWVVDSRSIWFWINSLAVAADSAAICDVLSEEICPSDRLSSAVVLRFLIWVVVRLATGTACNRIASIFVSCVAVSAWIWVVVRAEIWSVVRSSSEVAVSPAI